MEKYTLKNKGVKNKGAEGYCVCNLFSNSREKYSYTSSVDVRLHQKFKIKRKTVTTSWQCCCFLKRWSHCNSSLYRVHPPNPETPASFLPVTPLPPALPGPAPPTPAGRSASRSLPPSIPTMARKTLLKGKSDLILNLCMPPPCLYGKVQTNKTLWAGLQPIPPLPALPWAQASTARDDQMTGWPDGQMNRWLTVL